MMAGSGSVTWPRQSDWTLGLGEAAHLLNLPSPHSGRSAWQPGAPGHVSLAAKVFKQDFVLVWQRPGKVT